MRYWWDTVKTASYWRYAIFSTEALGKFFLALGVLYTLIEIADTFKVYTKDKHSAYGLFFLVALAWFYVISTRRPISKVFYKIPKKDYKYVVKIGDLFKETDGIIISSNSTFDTDMSSGLIAANSLQGQFAHKYFNGNTVEIDRQIEESLKNDSFELNEARPGKKKEYPIGTVARVTAHGQKFYLVAMSHMDENGTAYSNAKILDEALEKLWLNIAKKSDREDIVMPLMGTGRGRVPMPRKKVIEKIAQSFADASHDKTFSNKLTIVVRPEDAANFSLNLFQVRDYLSQSLHV